MRGSVKIALIALAVGVGSLAAGLPAMAESVTSSSSTTTTTYPGGGIAFGYNDGYWDRAHGWHAWKDQNETTTYRTTSKEHYYEYKHDRDPDQGWHEKETWWVQK